MKKAPMMKRVSRSASNEEGYILMMGICIMMVLMLFGVALAVMGLQEFDLSSRTKLMDQAYLIADAGVNSAAVAIENTPASPVPVYPVYPATASGITIPFGGGNFTYKIYQSEQNTDSTYKVIQSTGTITKQGKTVDRTILARIVIGAGGQDYDASFDYLMYNGMDSNGDGVSEGGTWAPTDLRFNSIIGGSFGFDGASPYPPTGGHYPKGAFYVDGSINIPTSIAGTLNIQGRIVATDNINIKNTWNAGTLVGVNGIKIDGDIDGDPNLVPGNVVAGIDGSGSTTITTDWNSGFASGINIPTGKVCGYNNVNLNANANIMFNNPMVVGGIRAGDNATINCPFNIAQPLQVTTSGIISGKNTTIYSKGFSGVKVSGNISAGTENSIAIFSGGNASNQGVSLYNNAASNINVGNIRSSGRVDMLAEYQLSNITVGKITTGNDVGSSTGGTGVNGTINSLLGWLLEPSMNINGQITSAGRVNLTTQRSVGWIKSKCSMTTQGVKSGTDFGGWGIVMGGNVFGDYNIQGNLESVGSITMNNTDGGRYRSQGIWSGGSISIGANADWLTDIGDDSLTISGSAGYPTIRARGTTTLSSADDIYVNGSDMFSVGAIDIRGNKPGIFSGSLQMYLAQGNTIYGGSSVTIRNDNSLFDCRIYTGNIASVGSIDFHSSDPSSTGTYYSLGNLSYYCNCNFIGGDSNAGNMWSTGMVRVQHDQTISGDMSMGWAYSASRVEMHPSWEVWPANIDINTNGMWAPSISADSYSVSGGQSIGNPGSPPVGTPSVGIPSQPAKPAVPDATVADDNHLNMLYYAGLSAPVKLLKPNWAYFETLAQQDDVANGPTTKICPNPNCRKTNPATNTVCGQNGNPPNGCGTSLTSVSPGPAHMIYAGYAGDQDHDASNGIQFKWDPTTPYSSNEVIYNGDPNVNVYITSLNWNNLASTFAGTIVSRGNVYITANTPMTWLVGTGQNLNIVSGWDIVDNTSGVSLIEQTDSQMHLWAYHDINLDNMNINLVGVNSFLGSFTAGDKVVFNSNSIWDKTTFKWSRWALDPVAWAPPFQVLDWKEL